jgi:hypothetical protein
MRLATLVLDRTLCSEIEMALIEPVIVATVVSGLAVACDASLGAHLSADVGYSLIVLIFRICPCTTGRYFTLHRASAWVMR